MGHSNIKWPRILQNEKKSDKHQIQQKHIHSWIYCQENAETKKQKTTFKIHPTIKKHHI